MRVQLNVSRMEPQPMTKLLFLLRTAVRSQPAYSVGFGQGLAYLMSLVTRDTAASPPNGALPVVKIR